MRVQINLDTMKNVQRFVNIASAHKANVYITDNAGLCVSAKSLLGALYAMEFDELWCECDEDIFTAIKDFVIY